MAIEAAFAVPHPPLIIPAVGLGREHDIQATVDSYDEVARRVAHIAPELVIVSSPHATAYRDWFHLSPGSGARGDMMQFRAYGTELSTTYDEEFVQLVEELAAREDFPAGTAGERDASLDHATYIPLWFIDKFYSGYKTMRVGLSGFGPLEHYRLGQLIAQAVEQLGRRAVYIASGDLSHKLTEDGPYGFMPEGPLFDEQITEAFARGDFMQLLSFDETFADKAAECGLRSFQIMAGALDEKTVDAELLSYEGPFGVGYGVAAFTVTGESAERCFGYLFKEAARRDVERRRSAEDAYIALARATIENHVRAAGSAGLGATLRDKLRHATGAVETPELSEHTTPEPQLEPEMLEQRAGVFVSLHKHGRLRGCIGTTSAVTSCIAEEIRRNAVSACSEDPRFDPVRPDELDELEISVDVLGAAEPIASTSELDPKRYGVIVSKGLKRGLLLPNLDGVDTVDEQVDIAKRKAGIAPYENVSLQRFEVVRHEVV